MKEQGIQTAIMAWLKSRDIWAVKVMTASRAGCPDIIGCYHGRFLAIEVKAPAGRMSPLQRYHADKIKSSKGLHIIARSVRDVELALFDAEMDIIKHQSTKG